MKCIYCDGETKVVATRKNQRRRECLDCNQIFKTVETPTSLVVEQHKYPEMLADFVARKLKHYRTGLGMSGYTLADIAGVTPQTIYEIENRKRSVNVSTLELLIGALGMTPSEFFKEDEEITE